MRRFGLIFLSLITLGFGLTLADTRAANDADSDGYPDVLGNSSDSRI